MKLLLLLPFLFFVALAGAQTVPSESPVENDVVFVNDRALSLSELEKSMVTAENKNDRHEQGMIHNRIGDYQWYAGKYPLAADHYYKALYIFQKLGDSLQIAQSFRNIGWIYLGQKNYSPARAYFDRSFNILSDLGKEKELIPAYDDLGILFRETRQFDKAIIACNNSIRLANKLDKRSLATSIISLATTYREMGNYTTAIREYRRAIKMKEEFEDPYNLCYAYVDLGRCYIALKDGPEAVKYISTAREMAARNKFAKVEIEALRYLGPAYELTGDYKKAFTFSNRYAILSDSVTNEQQDREIHEMQASHETAKKENYIRNLRKQRAISNVQLVEERKFQLVLYIFLALVIALAFFFFRSFTQKKRANKELSATYTILESRNKDIADSIDYAQQIQQARLPDHSFISAAFPESFVLFMPKDVVSGDFYWFAEPSPDLIAFAAADCTGHGIPGAFMSLIGMDTLHQAVLDKELRNPSEILAAINISMKKTLRQNDINSSSRDGMDLAFCLFDKSSRRLSYAGAHRPLILVRNNEVEERKATKQSIGGLTPDHQIFESHELQLIPGDCIYIFSDGFHDQFGGENDKKYSSRRFRDLLLKISNKPMNEQYALLKEEYTGWKKDCEQIDDVLVIGIRVS